MDGTQSINVSQVVDEQKFGWFNVGLIVLGWLATFADGYDILSMAYAAPAVVREWHVDRAALGIVFSASLWAYFVGAPAFGWIGDRYGRKKAIVLGCVWFGLFSFASMLASNLTEMFWLRFLTGMSLAGLAPNVLALAAEFSPRRRRALVMSLCLSGIVIGGSAAGWTSAALAGSFSWRAIFFVGGVLPILFAVLIWFAMPESIKYLTLKGGHEAEVARLARILKPGIVIAEGATFYIAGEAKKVAFRPSMLFAGSLLLITPLLWVFDISNYVTTNFINNWSPIVFEAAGISGAHSAVITSLYNVGSMAGGIAGGYMCDRFGPVGYGAMMVVGCFTVAFLGTPGLSETAIGLTMAISGFMVQGAQFGINATPGLIFPTSIRANGLAWTSAVARAGASLGPLLGGWLISLKLSTQAFFLAPAINEVLGTLLCFVVAWLCWRRYHGGRLDETAADVTPV